MSRRRSSARVYPAHGSLTASLAHQNFLEKLVAEAHEYVQKLRAEKGLPPYDFSKVNQKSPRQSQIKLRFPLTLAKSSPEAG